jgi:N-acetylneuraminic acid mutarotase
MRSIFLRLAALALVFGGCSSPPASEPVAPAPGNPVPEPPVTPVPPADPAVWHAASSLHEARMAHTATLLDDGSVLVVGGETIARDMLTSAEIYDPTAGTWSDAGKLPAPRSNHVAVRLKDGKVLVAGGGRSAPIGQPSSAEVTASVVSYDPATKRFEELAPLGTARSHAQAVLLDDGEVLVAGGGSNTTHETCNGVPDCGPLADALASVERFDPTTRTFRPAAPMKSARYSFSLTRMADGRVLAVGGVGRPGEALAGLKSAEIYDPKADSWTLAADLPDVDREHHSAILLPSGAVMVAGGKQANIGMLKTVRIFAGGTWKNATSYPSARTLPDLVVLASGHVLSVGGYNQAANLSIAEAALYDETSDRWTRIGDLATGRVAHTTTLLRDGSVLIAGGTVDGAETESCELASPAAAE